MTVLDVQADDPVSTPHRAPAHRFVMVGGVRLHLLDWGGEGRPTVLLHGVGGHAWMWAHLAPALTPLGRPLALDLRGFGDSQWSPDAEYTTARHAADVLEIADALGFHEYDLVGFSWGGLVGIEVAVRAPERVRRLAIIDIAPATAAPPDAIPPNFRGTFADHSDAVEGERALAPRADEQLLGRMAALGTRSGPDGGLVRKLDPTFLRAWPFRAEDHWDALERVRAATLVVRAGDSPMLAEQEARRMVERLHDGRLETVADSGHLVAFEQPARLSTVLTGFLRAA